MNYLNKRHVVLFLLFVVCCGPLSVVLSGCAEDNKPPSASSGYYTGPMEGKGKKAEGGAADPAAAKGGVKTE